MTELESQELKQITVKDFVHMVEGREDLIGRPVYFAQWPNGNTHPFVRSIESPDLKTLQAISDEYNAWIRHHAAGHSYDDFLQAKLKEKNT